jgi:hypothetical protein
MALNPFFLQGSASEQRLVQELINEQLKIYGIEVTYIPRKFVKKETIIEEVTSSKFDDNFLIEAYLSNYEGYSGSGDILTKFGMSLRDEVSLIISRERFEDFIAPFLNSMDEDEIEVSSRPREGDLIYFPLGQRLFEVKFVEHEQPFYQLGKLYVYELKCELFEYEDEVIDTSISEIDKTIKNIGNTVSLQLFSTGEQATVTPSLTSGYVRRIFINNDGYGYRMPPNVSISTAPVGGINATAVAITTYIGGVYSVKEVLLTNAGAGYTTTPQISFVGGSGVGAAATCEIVKDYFGITNFNITNGGVGYSTEPNITIPLPALSVQNPAKVKPVVGAAGTISSILISDAGKGYIGNPTITIDPPPLLTGIGTYWYNEVVIGSRSGVKARVRNWDKDTNILRVGITGGKFFAGEIIQGSSSQALYNLKNEVIDIELNPSDNIDKYKQNDEIQYEADLIVDFTESNPFGVY